VTFDREYQRTSAKSLDNRSDNGCHSYALNWTITRRETILQITHWKTSKCTHLLLLGPTRRSLKMSQANEWKRLVAKMSTRIGELLETDARDFNHVLIAQELQQQLQLWRITQASSPRQRCLFTSHVRHRM